MSWISALIEHRLLRLIVGGFSLAGLLVAAVLMRSPEGPSHTVTLPSQTAPPTPLALTPGQGESPGDSVPAAWQAEPATANDPAARDLADLDADIRAIDQFIIEQDDAGGPDPDLAELRDLVAEISEATGQTLNTDVTIGAPLAADAPQALHDVQASLEALRTRMNKSPD